MKLKLSRSVLLLTFSFLFVFSQGYCLTEKSINSDALFDFSGESCNNPTTVNVETDCSVASSITLDFSIATDIDASGENPSCDAAGNYGYFISFSAPSTGSVVMNFGGSANNIGLEVYESCDGTAVSACTNNTFDAGDSSEVIGGLTPGNTYIAVFWRDSATGTADICIEEGPSCPFPASLDAVNLSGSSADLVWTETGTATLWNIEYGPIGFVQGTGTLINNVTTNPYSLTGLTQSTSYDFFVQAVCDGNETSDFSGRFTFFTPPETNHTIDCSSGPINLDYCYENGGSTNPEIFTFTSNDGSPLNLVFNSGNVESGWDEFVVLDSNGSPFPGYALSDNNYGNNGDLSGLSFQSSGDSISFYINSDGSVSCASGSGSLSSGINYTVSCATCVNPEVDFAIINDCDNGDQFLVDVDITNLGDATSLTISNNFDDSTTSVNGVGIYQVGPFPFLQEIILTVNNDQDINCFVSSDSLEVLTCPPANDEPCDAIVLDLNASQACDYLGSGTIFGATDSGISNDFCSGVPNDDVWFQFEATSENQIISVQNVVGGTPNLDHTVYEGTCDNLTELYCDESITSAATQLVVGSTYFVRVFSSGSVEETATFDICIRETAASFACEQAVPFCSSNGTFTTANAVSVPGLGNVACLSTTPNPTWNTLQIGSSGTIEVEIQQTTADGLSGLDVDFAIWGPFNSVDEACSNILLEDCPTCPNNLIDPNFYPFGNIVDCSYSAAPIESFTIDNAQYGEVYLLLVTNFSGHLGTISIEQTNLGQEDAGSLTAELEIDLGPDINVCELVEDTVVIDATTPFADNYEWYFNGVLLVSGEDEGEIEVSESGVYTLIAYNENCDVLSQDEVAVSFLDCSTVGLINVSAFNDNNANMAVDSGEFNFTNGYFTYEVNNDGIINTVASSTGAFTIASDDELNTYDFNYYFYDEYEDCFDVSTLSFDDVSVLFGESVDVEFPIVDAGTCEDIGLYLISQQAPRPGFDHLNYLVINNFGLTTVSGTVEYTLDEDLVINAISEGSNFTTATTTDGFNVQFSDLAPGESITVSISLMTPATVVLGEMVTNTATYTTAVNDMVTENNSTTVTEEVIGAYDPNDKMEAHGPEVVYDDFVASDEWLYYTVRFQNLGTAEAINIRIEDVLDSQLDQSTFQMLRSSHDYVVTRIDNNLEWVFSNINLPAEQDDADGSIGFVYFRVKPLQGYNVGTVIPNSAAIYFDFNAPIITNTFTTTFVETLSVGDVNNASFSIYPNPAKDLVTIQLANFNDSYTIELIDIQGKLIYKKAINSDMSELNISSLKSGLYFVQLKSGSKTMVQKLIIE
jgi:uncharacterized repeat protein (TIGR01451 family)